MRLLFVSESIWQLGPVYDLHMLAEGLVERGHNVFAIDPGEEVEHVPDEPLQLQKVARYIPSAPVSLVSPRIVPNRYRFPLPQMNWAKCQYNRFRTRYTAMDELLKQEKVGLIVLFSAARMGLVTLLLARKYKIPVVFRNVDMLYKLWSGKREQFIVRQLEKLVYRRVDRLCALTPRYAKYLESLGANIMHTDLLLFPIDITRFNPDVPHQQLYEKWDIQESDKVVLFMGALYPFGGLKQLIESIDVLIAKVPNLKLLIVGDGVIRQDLIDRVKEKGLVRHVIITGHEPFELMPSYITLADVCINVFPINETTADIFSAKIVQYLACGRPTVSSALRGITTLIPEKGAGVIYCKTIPEIVEQIAKLLDEDAKIGQMGTEGIEYVSKHHVFSHVLDSFEAIVKKSHKTDALTV